VWANHLLTMKTTTFKSWSPRHRKRMSAVEKFAPLPRLPPVIVRDASHVRMILMRKTPKTPTREEVDVAPRVETPWFILHCLLTFINLQIS
jgi:hypothetical protein